MRRFLCLLFLATTPVASAAQSEPAATDSLARAALALVRDAETRARHTPTIVIGRVFEEAFGMDPAARAGRMLRRALVIDAGHPAAAHGLGRLGLLTGDRETLEQADRALLAARARHPDDPDLLLAAAEVRLALGRPAEAGELLEQAPLRNDSVRAILALAALGSQGREDEGAALYFRAAEDPDIAARWIADLDVLADGAERARWGMADSAGRIAWLREFWESRAALAGVGTADRIAEHYRRLTHARLHFARNKDWGAPPRNALVWERSPHAFDDRGLIYIRHGDPERVIRTGIDDESWLYHEVDGRPRLYNFLRMDGEWRLPWDFPCEREWQYDRGGVEPLVRHCNGQSRVRVRKYSRIALETDSDRPPVDNTLPLAHALYRFRAASGATEFVVSAAVPADSIRGDAIDVSFAVVDTAFAGVARTEARVPVVRGEAGEARVAMSVEARPVGGVYRLLLRDGADTLRGIFVGDVVEPLDFRGDTLAISDLVPARASEGGVLRRGSIAIDPMVRTEAATGRFRLYYELYGVPTDTTLETTVVVEREDPGLIDRIFGGRARTTLRFEDRSPEDGSVVRVVRDVAADLERGRWRLRVEVAAGGRRIARETLLIVR